jgi:hypothetical protein
MNTVFGVEEVNSDEDILLPDASPEQPDFVPDEQPVPVTRRVEPLQLQVLSYVSADGRLQIATGYSVPNDGYFEGRNNCLMLAVNGPDCGSEGPIFKKSPTEIRVAMATWFNSLDWRDQNVQRLFAAFDSPESTAITNQLVENGTIPYEFLFHWLSACGRDFLSKPVAIVLTLSENSANCIVSTTTCFSCRGAQEVIFLQLSGPHYVRWMPYGGNFRHILPMLGIDLDLPALHKLESDTLDNNLYVTRRMSAYIAQLEQEKMDMQDTLQYLNHNQRLLDEMLPVKNPPKKRVRLEVESDVNDHHQQMLLRIRTKGFVPINMEEISRFMEDFNLDPKEDWRHWCKMYQKCIDLPGGNRFVFADKDDTSLLEEQPATDDGFMPP